MKFQIVQFLFQCVGFICPGYNSTKSQLPPNMPTFDEILNESKIFIKQNEMKIL
ncbi:hypothetical protein U3516DRAFT_752110 [Neocallimastix sp. 'constans']